MAVNAQDELLELEVERLVAGGEGLGFVDGAAVFVPDAAPGDRVRARVRESRRDFLRADIVELLVPGPGRREPPCPVASRCGGCSLQHLEYDAQLGARLAILRESFSRVADLELPDTITLHRSAEWGYRLRAELKVVWRQGRPVVGYLARRSHDVVPVPGCPILGPGFERLYRPLLKLLNGRRYLFRGLTGVGYLEGDEGAIVVLRYNREPGRRGPLFNALRWLEQEGGVAGALVQGPHGSALNWGRKTLTLALDDIALELAPGRFVQTHRDLARLLWQRVRQHASERPESLALDLYAGSGFFTTALAPHFEELVSVEADQRASKAARRCLDRNGLRSVRSVCAPAGEYLKDAATRLADAFVLVDPPRRGLEPPTSETLMASPPAALLYISCDAVTLARDAGRLGEAGLVPTRVELFDMFPHTAHFETLVLFEALGACP